MDLSRIKNLVKQNGDKFIFVENGEPEIVMMSFHEYQKLTQRDFNVHSEYSQTIRKNLNYTNDASDNSAVYSDNNADVESGSFGLPHEVAGVPVRLEDIRLEDLPI